MKGKFTGEKPFRVGRIEQIFTRSIRGGDDSLRVRKFYRPEDTCLDDEKVQASALNKVFWSDDISTISSEKSFIQMHSSTNGKSRACKHSSRTLDGVSQCVLFHTEI